MLPQDRRRSMRRPRRPSTEDLDADPGRNGLIRFKSMAGSDMRLTSPHRIVAVMLQGRGAMGTMAGAASNDDVIRAAFERCPCGLIVVDESGHIRVVNREIERQFGYAREELLGQLVEMLVPDNFAKDHPSSRAQYTAMPTARP